MKELTDDYEKNLGDERDILNTDVNINPDYYIHITILNTLNVLKADNIANFKEKTQQFIIMVDTLENVTKATNKLNKVTEEGLNDYEEKIKKKQQELINDDGKQFKIANYKLQLILQELNESKASNTPLIYN